MAGHTNSNADAAEVARFNALASRWWDPQGEMRLLHRMNPVRLAYIRERASLAGQRCLDVGCGAGLLCESLAREGADVTGIDLADESLIVARLHLSETGINNVTYRRATAEDMASANPGAYDIVTCLEVLEHVPDPASTIAACAQLARPGGHLFFSTINRNPGSYLVTVLGAEYLLGLLPKGTHDYERFIKPSELAHWCRQAGLQLLEFKGMTYNPLTQEYRLGQNCDVNYALCCARDAQ